MTKSEAVRGDILASLAEVFRAHGYEGATLALISEATGLGKGSLYGAFGDKHGLFMRALDD